MKAQLDLIKHALQQHARCEANWCPRPPWCFELTDYRRPDHWLYLQAWRWSYTIKLLLCLLLPGRRGLWGDLYYDAVTIAEFDWCKAESYEFGPYWEWSCLAVAHGWRPQTWRYDISSNSSI